MKDISTKKIYPGPIEKEIYLPKIEIDKVTDSDYKRGYIWRYFFRQCNDINSMIYEINETEYNKVKDYFFYKGLKIKWKIIGSKTKATAINTNIINTSKKLMPGIDKILKRDVLLYWKDIPENQEDFDVTNKFLTEK